MRKIISKGNKSKKNILGLDIGNTYIKIVELEGSSYEDAALVNFSIEQIPQDLMIMDGKLPNVEKLGQVIKSCWKKSGSKVKEVTICLNQSAIISKKIVLQKDETEEGLLYQVEGELAKFLPTGSNKEDLLIDFYDLGFNEHSPTESDMLLVAAKKENIEEKMALVESAGLEPSILEVEQFTIQNMLRSYVGGEEFDKKTILLADCSGNDLSILIFKKGELSYSKDISIGGKNFTEDLAVNLGVSFEEAEKIKIRNEQEDNEIYKNAVKMFLNNYASEFIRGLQYYTTSAANPEIHEAYLIGGMAGFEGLLDTINKALEENGDNIIKTDVQIAKVLSKMKLKNKIDLAYLNKHESSMFLATGLAARHFLRLY